MERIKIKYKDRWFIIHDVPTYRNSDDDILLPRIVRKNVKELLKQAYENNDEEIEYKEIV